MNIQQAIEKAKEIEAAATEGQWPKHFARIDDSQGGSAATGPVIRLDDEDEEDQQAQADQDFIAHARNTHKLLLDVAEAAAWLQNEMVMWAFDPNTEQGQQRMKLNAALQAFADHMGKSCAAK